MPLQLQGLNGFLGVNLKRDRLSLADAELARAINVDLHSMPGVIQLRRGHSAQSSIDLPEAIRRLAKVNGVRYQVAGTVLYRNGTSILTGLSSDLITNVLAFRPLNDTTTWAFIADSEAMRKDDGTNLRLWGIEPPSVAPQVAPGGAGSLTGDYFAKYTFVRKVGSAIAHESNPGIASTVASLSSQVMAYTNVFDSFDPQVTHKRIYRTQAGGSVYLFDVELPQGTTSANSNNIDAALGDAVEEDNNIPPNAAWPVEFQGHVFLIRNSPELHAIRWSKRYRPESFPTENILYIGSEDDRPQCAVRLGGLLGVFTRITKYRIQGNSTTGFVPFEALTRRGTPAFNAVVPTEFGAIFPARDGIFVTNFSTPDQEMSQDIEALFSAESRNDYLPVNWDVPETFSAAVYKQRYYFTYADTSSTTPNMIAVFSNDTKKWYFWDLPVQSLFVEEDIDQLAAGTPTGLVYVLEDADSRNWVSDVTLDARTQDIAGPNHQVRKLYYWFRVDAELSSGSLAIDFYVDNVLKRSVTVTGNRTRPMFRLPEGCMGYSWHARLRYTGLGPVKFYNVQAMCLPIEMVAA